MTSQKDEFVKLWDAMGYLERAIVKIRPLAKNELNLLEFVAEI